MEFYKQIPILITLISSSLSANIPISTDQLLSEPVTKPTQPQIALSYNELQYILNARNGFTEVPKITLSVCARAILGCCRQKDMNIMCSETLGCGAHFFDDNPCEDKFITVALKAAKSFYEQINTVDTTT